MECNKLSAPHLQTRPPQAHSQHHQLRYPTRGRETGSGSGMLRTAVLVCLVGVYQATAAPYAAVTATEDHSSGETPKVVISMAEDADEPDVEDGGFDLVEPLPEDEGDLDDLAFMNRDTRSKNFVRFGRSASRPSRTVTNNKEGNKMRYYNRGEADDNFIRLGRSANFVRLGRASSDTSVKTPSIRSSNSNFIRLGRDKNDNNFIRFGRGKNDFIRLGRDGNEEEIEDVAENNESLTRMSRAGGSDRSFIRLGKANYPASSSFIRLGRKDNFLRFGKADNFLRFGKADNFLRFGRGGSGSNFIRFGKKADNFLRFGKGGSASNFIRLGKKADNFLRFGKGGSTSNFIRLGKKADNFLRFGRGASNNAAGKYGDGARFGRANLADRNFIRLGRSDPDVSRDGEDNFIKPEEESSWSQFVRHTPGSIRLGERDSKLPDNKLMRFGRDLENVEDGEQHGTTNRSKRSTSSSEGEPTPEDEYDNEDRATMEDAPFRYYDPSARMPNFVFAPELSVLPPLYSKRGAGGTGNGNFIRFG